MKFLLTLVKRIFAIIFLAVVIILGSWINYRSAGFGASGWYVPLLIILAAFIGAIVYLMWLNRQNLTSLSLADGIQSISSIFSTLFVVFGLFFVVTEFGQKSLTRDSKLAKRTADIVASARNTETVLRGLRKNINNQPKGADVAVLLAEDVEKALNGYLSESFKIESCIRYRECDIQVAKYQLCEISEIFGPFAFEKIKSYNVTAFWKLKRLVDHSSSQLMKHCSSMQALFFLYKESSYLLNSHE